MNDQRRVLRLYRRRDFLRASLSATVIAAGGALLAACGGTAATATTAPTATTAAKPTTAASTTSAATSAATTSASAASTSASAATTSGGSATTSAASSAAGSASPASSGPPADLAKDQTLTIATGSSGSASFVFQSLAGGGDQESWQPLTWMPPMYFDVDLKLQPGIFNSWKNNTDYTVWTFTIDPRAKFSDNTPVTAADVKGTWQVMTIATIMNSRIKGYIGNVKGFATENKDIPGLVVKDDHTLEVTLATADPLFHWRVATTHMNPVKAAQAAAKPDDFWKPENKPAVTGPYMLQAYNADQGTATLVKNPNWWLGEGQYLDKINFKFVTDPGTVATLIQNKQADASLQGLPLNFKSQLPDMFRPIKAFGFNCHWISGTVVPTDDANVRKALTLAVNFQDVFKAAYPDGGATFATELIDPDLPCYDKDHKWYTYDPAAAKAALAASKYQNATNLPKIRVTPRGVDPALNRAVQSILEFWRQNLGVNNVEFKQQPTEFGPDQDKINMSRDDVVIRFPDTATYLFTGIDSQGDIASGDMLKGYKNPKVDQLVEQALGLPVDDPKRCDLSLQAQQVFMDDYQVIFSGIPDTTLNARDYVKNYSKGPDRGLIQPWKMYIAQH
jgi:peptide/nickel transport system substrate-binding protein